MVCDKLLLTPIYEVAFLLMMVPMRGTLLIRCQQKFVADHQNHPIEKLVRVKVSYLFSHKVSKDTDNLR